MIVLKGKWLLGFLFLLSCDRNSTSGIIPQTQLITQKFDRANTYYIYDYVSKDQLLEYSLNQEHTPDRKSIHYYFSHNANIPSHEIKFSKSVAEIHEILKRYKHSLKFVFVKESSEKEQIIDCLDDPSNFLCNFE